MSDQYALFTNKDIELIHNNFADMQELIAKVLKLLSKPDTTSELIKANEAHLTRVNNKIVDLLILLEKGVDVQNKQILSDLKSITQNIRDYPSDVTVKNMTQIPEWMQSDKSIKDLEKAVIEVQQRIQEASQPQQAPESFTAVRRVIRQGNRLLFDDNPTGSGRGGGGGGTSTVEFTFTDAEGNDTPVTASTPLPVDTETTDRTDKVTQVTTITSSVAETTIGTAVTSRYLDLYGLVLTNTSSSPTQVTIKDSTAGTTRLVLEVPAFDQRGFAFPLSAAISQTSTGNNWTATCGTSVASLIVTAIFKKV